MPALGAGLFPALCCLCAFPRSLCRSGCSPAVGRHPGSGGTYTGALTTPTRIFVNSGSQSHRVPQLGFTPCLSFVFVCSFRSLRLRPVWKQRWTFGFTGQIAVHSGVHKLCTEAEMAQNEIQVW